jgi:sugar lactone lactonase YvrE
MHNLLFFFQLLTDVYGSFQRSHAFDVDPKTQTFLNRRVLAYVDAGVPDGVQVDTNGNVYTACADGIQVRINTYLHRASEF